MNPTPATIPWTIRLAVLKSGVSTRAIDNPISANSAPAQRDQRMRAEAGRLQTHFAVDPDSGAETGRQPEAKDHGASCGGPR